MKTFSLLAVALALLVATFPAAAQTVDHYDMSRVGTRGADGYAAYPAGVSDPSRANPAAPPTEVAVPLPPSPDTPIRSLPQTVPAGLAYGATPPPGGTVPQVPAYASPTQVYPPLLAPSAAATCLPATWYTRVDYFHWNEKVGGADFVNESGALFTLGYQRRSGFERYRAELFGGQVNYKGYLQSDSGDTETLESNTGYLGLRGEYEMLVEPDFFGGHVAFLGGLGTRFWIRDLHDDTAADGTPVYGYQETWWTFYPYLGAETHYLMGNGLDLYSESRVGATVLTYQFASTSYADPYTGLITERPLWPQPGVVANVEIGLRGSRFYIAARGEVMRWEDSAMVQGAYQPRSTMYTLGGRLGFMF